MSNWFYILYIFVAIQLLAIAWEILKLISFVITFNDKNKKQHDVQIRKSQKAFK